MSDQEGNRADSCRADATPRPGTGKPPKPPKPRPNEIDLTKLMTEYIQANKNRKNG